jgi:Holliday junction resolvase RusA-like endonuclease
MIELVVYGAPVAQGRPKFSTHGGFARAYDPAKSRDYKDYVRLAAVTQMAGRPPLQGALELSVRIYRPIPKSFSLKKASLAEQGILRPITKPDTDNYIKGIKDAITGICWQDDSQVVAYIEPTGKYYSITSRIEVTIKEWQPHL